MAGDGAPDRPWELGLHTSDHDSSRAFFGNDYHGDSSLLNDFTWNLLEESNGGVGIYGYDAGFLDFKGIASDFAGNAADGRFTVEDRITEDDPILAEGKVEAASSIVASPSNPPSVSSSSSEDRPDSRSMTSGASSSADPAAARSNSKVKKVQKRIRQQRFAFVTKSEVDHLEDGYRWRKYGQKAVKNSPFPRSYYRCTNGNCEVKKRVERSCEDPTLVITTYEGQHCHFSVGFPRGHGFILPPNNHPRPSSLLSSFPFQSDHKPHSISPLRPQPINDHVPKTTQASSDTMDNEGLLGDIVQPPNAYLR